MIAMMAAANSKGAKYEPAETLQKVFTICVANNWLGIPIKNVRTVFRTKRIALVPMAPKEVAGLVNVRGEVLTAIHLSEYLGLAAPEIKQETLLVGIEHRDENFGFIIDQAGDVVTIDETARIMVPSTPADRMRSVQLPTYRVDDTLIPLLDIEAMLATMKCQLASNSIRS